MQIITWLNTATDQLKTANIQTARLDALIILEDVLGHDRAWLLAHDDTEINDDKQAELEKLLTRRVQHEPLAYIRGHAEFFGREFKVTPDVLVPRPESEAIITALKQLEGSGKLRVQGKGKLCIGDVGTGSGALGITAALELPQASIELLDISKQALMVAKTNVDLFTLKITVTESDLLLDARQYHHVLLCNLPYVPDDYAINQAATHEPALALFAGPDGLDLYRQLFDQVNALLEQPLYILTEAFPSQHAEITYQAGQIGYKLIETDDFIQVFERN